MATVYFHAGLRIKYAEFGNRDIFCPCRYSYFSREAVWLGRTPQTFSSTPTSHKIKILKEGFDAWGAHLKYRRCVEKTKIRANNSSEKDSESKVSTSDSSNDASSNNSKGINTPSNPSSQSSSSPSPKREKKWKGSWWNGGKWQWQPIIQAQEIGVLLLQLGIVMFAMRLLRPGIPLPGSEPRPPPTYISVPFSDFMSKINNDQVLKVEVDGVHIMFRLRSETGSAEADQSAVSRSLEAEALIKSVAPTKRIVYTTTRPADIKTPYEKMLENQVEFGSPDKRSGGLLNSALIALFYIAVLAGLLQRFPISFPQSPGQLRTRKTSRSGGTKVAEHASIITFADVAGVDEAKEELEEIVEFLRNPDRYIRLGARPPRGVLLVGLPGTGKTLLAKAVAGEAEVPFISCSASEFVELYVGMGASRVRDLFARAKKEAPSIIFIDEIDAVAKSRDGRFRIVSNDEREQTLNQLLTEMDGFESSSAVIVLGATNRSDVLDPALRRPGRFDRVVMGIEKKHAKLQGSERAVVARHEAGHAVVGTAVANLLPGQPRVEKLSILPRSGGALGFTYIPPTTEDRYLLFIDELRGRLVTLLGGRAAEEFIYSGRISTGALDDIKRATDIAYKAVAEYGLNQSIGPISLATLSSGGLDDSGGAAGWARDQGHLVDLVQREVKALLQSALEVALSVVHANPTVLEGLGAHLEEKEKVEGEELQEWLNLVVAPAELRYFVRGESDNKLKLKAST
ncbi:ATP-dependent zinc metalloprotease FTSH 7, chloroplastic isoform X3 [Phalaenopsis equestris]|uniref:ATP-dependent zinc metalloprotease FTSH 7, chloroplastic isoform X3 n=1 Tax=Phalaenopsis equestris TaxID=78828 RepID=UPI0009E5B202|nr:ATP-dependent zinc metalloprotease FTSH 7, chloroplastic isoform X3 [Phalaenopsis equestris]